MNAQTEFEAGWRCPWSLSSGVGRRAMSENMHELFQRFQQMFAERGFAQATGYNEVKITGAMAWNSDGLAMCAYVRRLFPQGLRGTSHDEIIGLIGFILAQGDMPDKMPPLEH